MKSDLVFHNFEYIIGKQISLGYTVPYNKELTDTDKFNKYLSEKRNESIDGYLNSLWDKHIEFAIKYGQLGRR